MKENKFKYPHLIVNDMKLKEINISNGPIPLRCLIDSGKFRLIISENFLWTETIEKTKRLLVNYQPTELNNINPHNFYIDGFYYLEGTNLEELNDIFTKVGIIIEY